MRRVRGWPSLRVRWSGLPPAGMSPICGFRPPTVDCHRQVMFGVKLGHAMYNIYVRVFIYLFECVDFFVHVFVLVYLYLRLWVLCFFMCMYSFLFFCVLYHPDGCMYVHMWECGCLYVCVFPSLCFLECVHYVLICVSIQKEILMH